MSGMRVIIAIYHSRISVLPELRSSRKRTMMQPTSTTAVVVEALYYAMQKINHEAINQKEWFRIGWQEFHDQYVTIEEE